MKDIQRDIFQIAPNLESLESRIEFYLDNFDYSKASPDDHFTASMFRQIYIQLYELNGKLQYMKKPVVDEGYLVKNRYGRYELNGREFTCGSPIELLITRGDEIRWVLTRIEHHEDYYAVGYKDIDIINVRVRVRRR